MDKVIIGDATMTETNLIRYDVARQALQAASTIDDAKQIKDKVEALRAYARQRNDVQMEAWLSELKLRADRRIGEISSKLDKAKANQSSSLIPTSGKKHRPGQSAIWRCREKVPGKFSIPLGIPQMLFDEERI